MTDAMTGDTRLRPLITAAGVFTVAVLLHNADHLRRGTEHVSAGVFWLGTTAVVAEVFVVCIVVARHRLAPTAAALIGAALAVGYLVVHFPPDLGWFSDSFTSGHDVSPLSWIAASIEVLAALLVATVGASTAWRLRRDAHGVAPRGWAATAVHPPTIVMTIGSVAVLVISVMQR